MTILAFDLSGNACSVALGHRQGHTIQCLGEDHQPMAQGQPNALFPLIQSLMNRLGVAVQDLSAIAVTRGPGSFTGIRAGLAAAKGLALGRSLPLFGISTFDLYAFKAPAQAFPLLVILESKRSDLYVQLYQNPQTPLWGVGETLEIPALVRRLDNPKNLSIAGDGQGHLSGESLGAILPEVREIYASDMLAYLSGQTLDPALFPCDPLYLRPPLVTGS